MLQNFRHTLALLLIISFVTMGISPACEFISGDENYIEICTDSNEVERITLAEAGFAPKPAPSEHQSKKSDCMFCYAGSHAKAGTLSKDFVLLSLASGYLRQGSGSFVPETNSSEAFDARGPPTSVV